MGDQTGRRERISDAVQALYLFARVEVAGLSEYGRNLMREQAADTIAEHTDTLVSGAPPDRHAPSGLGATAKAVALLAYAEGGVTFLDRHYCVNPHGTCPGGRNGTEADVGV